MPVFFLDLFWKDEKLFGLEKILFTQVELTHLPYGPCTETEQLMPQ